MGKWRAIYSGFQTVCGLSAFIVFLILQNYPAAVFGFVAASINAINAHLNWLDHKGRLSLWYEYNELEQMFWLGFWTAALGITGFVYFLAKILLLQSFVVDIVVVCVWTALATYSGCVLMYYSNKYVKEHRRLLVAVIEA